MDASADGCAHTRTPLIRRAHPADLGQIAQIEAASYETPWPEHFFARCLEVGYEFWVVANKADDVHAYAVLSLQGGVAHLMNLCVHAEQRRKGIGRTLLEHLIRLADERRSGLFLEVRASNRAARELYERSGLEILGLRRGYYDSCTGREDAVVMGLPWGCREPGTE